MQILLICSTEGAQADPEPRASPFTGVGVRLTSAIVVIFAGPFVHHVADGRMARMATLITPPPVGIELGTAGRTVFSNTAAARPRVGVIIHPKAVLTRLPRH